MNANSSDRSSQSPLLPDPATGAMELVAMLDRYIEHYDAKPSITYIRLTRDETHCLRERLTEAEAALNALRAEVAARDELLCDIEQYMRNEPAVWRVFGLLKRIRAITDASREALQPGEEK